MRHVYRHLQIRHFSVGPFAFENFILKIENDEDQVIFESLLAQLPVMYKHAIVNVTQPSDQDGESGGPFGDDAKMPIPVSLMAEIIAGTAPTVSGTASATTVQPLPESGGSTVQGALETSKIPDPTTTTTSTTTTKA